MAIKTNKGEDLNALALQKPLLLVFLRHFGCTFCRETMTELSERREEIEKLNFNIVLVHMVPEKMANSIFQIYGLHSLSHISDPKQRLYAKFGLKKAGVSAFFRIKVFYRAFVAGLLKGHYIGKPAGDPYQMPGIFVFYKNTILNKFIYKCVADRPNYMNLIMLK